MATVKKANVPPTHPTVWIGLGLAVVGLLVATYAYTGARVYEIGFAIVALLGAVLALAGILVAAWGRSIMAARASRSRRATFKEDALALGKPVAVKELADPAPTASEDAPTIAAPREKKRFSFPMPKRGKAEKPAEAGTGTSGASVFAFKRRAPEPAPSEATASPASTTTTPAPEPAAEPAPAEAPPAIDAELDAIGDLGKPKTVRVTLKCPSCASTFSAEGVRPFDARCPSCGFAATV